MMTLESEVFAAAGSARPFFAGLVAAFTLASALVGSSRFAAGFGFAFVFAFAFAFVFVFGFAFGFAFGVARFVSAAVAFVGDSVVFGVVFAIARECRPNPARAQPVAARSSAPIDTAARDPADPPRDPPGRRELAIRRNDVLHDSPPARPEPTILPLRDHDSISEASAMTRLFVTWLCLLAACGPDSPEPPDQEAYELCEALYERSRSCGLEIEDDAADKCSEVSTWKGPCRNLRKQQFECYTALSCADEAEATPAFLECEEKLHETGVCVAAQRH